MTLAVLLTIYRGTIRIIRQQLNLLPIVTSRNILLALDRKNEVTYMETVEFLEELFKFKEMKIGIKCHWKPCQTSLILTTQSDLSIQLEIIDTWDFEFVLMGRFTCVENFFSSVRPILIELQLYHLKQP